MIVISHRGNLDGRNPDCENNPTYIKTALDSGFDVEIDVWFKDGEFFLGHDAPTYLVERNWLRNRRLWCHAKNHDALKEMWFMNLVGEVNFFWHETDKMTMTSRGIPWLFPGNYSEIGITVWLDRPNQNIPHMWGVCTDYPLAWRNNK